MNWLKLAAAQYPNKAAIIYSNQTITYKMLYHNAMKVAYQLNTLDERRIAIQAENTLEDVYFIHGAILAGIEMVMINKHLTTKEITGQMKSVDTRLCFSNQTLDMDCIHKQQFITRALNQSNLFKGVDNKDEDILSIMFTSGTTGVQKAVPQRFKNHVASAVNCKKTFVYDHDAVWLDVLPLFHISGLSILLRAVMDGCTVVLHDQFEPSKIIQDLAQYKVTHLSLVPQTLERLIQNGLNERYHLQGVLIGGAKLDERLLETSRRLNIPIYTSFGMTETCSQMITATPEDIQKHFKSVGRMNDNLKLFETNDGIYEIGVRGGNVMDGYLYPENANDISFKEGYFLTGDIGYEDDGYLYILDRRKDLIISGGENIYPSEIEQIILNHCDIKAVAVIGVPDEKWGSRPVCLYEAQENQDSEIQAILNTHLAKYKHPKTLIHVENLMRTSNGKISRSQIKDWYLNDYLKA
ncbi:o-succinylbenzoate--CoA ligase [Macrococcus sp. DPC7161]|uniref:o-succinylbenzoate--CoA ligase n=1 Tax=Macrococcus sp. DPC7161 TaxID=2507060 RepID=UPI00100AA666|nr:o-succinylbenzoate--CoA ligase [Macrococcus sp. DPC7161]RXK17361.1 o-succinylbenzoate--CoA ligase [Macrococcus sp. DPC7161]